MQVLTKKPLCFIIEKNIFYSEDRIDILFFHPDFIESNNKIFSSSYPIYKFDDIIQFMTDGKHGGWNFVKKGILFIRNTNVKEEEIDLNDVKYISNEDHDTIPRAHLKDGDVLYTTIGTIGVSAVVNKEIEGANINQNLVRIVLNKEKIIPRFFSIFLNSSIGHFQSERNSTGNIQKIINYPTIKNFVLPIPPKNIQEEIIKFNQNARLKRKNNLKKIETLRSELDNYFLKNLNLFYSEKKEELFFIEYLEDRLDPFFYSPKFKQNIDILKKGAYQLKKLGELIKISDEQINTNEEPDRLFKYIQIQNVDEKNHRIFSYTPVLGKDAPGRAKMLIRDGDILLPVLGGSIKSVAIVQKEFDNEVATNGFSILRIKDERLRFFIFYYITTSFAQMQIERNLAGAIMPSISITDLKNILVPLPDINTQEKIVSKIKEIDLKIIKLQLEADSVIKIAKEKIEEMILGK